MWKFIAATSLVEAAAKQPHIVFTLVDDLGFNDAGWRPAPDGPSSDLAGAWPVTEKYAKEGVTMNNYYTQPICTPTRGAFMSGRYPIRLGLQHAVINPGVPYGLPLDEVTLADKLSAAGYRNLGVGKWHLGAHTQSSLPMSRGFDEWYGYWYGWSDYWTHSSGIGGPGDCQVGTCFLDLHENSELDATQNGTYATFRFSEKLDQMLQTHKDAHDDKPFFLYYAMQNVHGPLESPSEWLSKEPCNSISNSARQIFCAQALMADEAFGNVTRSVQSLFPNDDVVYIVSGDNGGNPHDGGNNMPLRGKKASLWEGGVRNNAFIWSNSNEILPAGRRGSLYTNLMHVTDWHATILDLAGVSDDNGYALDGVSHLDAIQRGSTVPRTEMLINIDPHSGGAGPDAAGNVVESAYRMGDWKLLLDVADDSYHPLPGSLSSSKGRLNALYNITADPTEITNLYDSFPDVVKEMSKKLSQLTQEQLYPCNCGNYCTHGVAECPYDSSCISAAQASGSWTPWLSGANVLNV